jgi:hypothetical protein
MATLADKERELPMLFTKYYLGAALDVHASQDLSIFPPGVEAEFFPWNGSPFSEHWLLTKGELSIRVSFGVGGHYKGSAKELLHSFFKD